MNSDRTTFSRRRKSPTVSGESPKLPFADWYMLRKVPTPSAQFKAPEIWSFKQKAAKIAKKLANISQIREPASPEIKWCLFADRRTLKRVGTLSPQFKAILVLVPGGAV